MTKDDCDKKAEESFEMGIIDFEDIDEYSTYLYNKHNTQQRKEINNEQLD